MNEFKVLLFEHSFFQVFFSNKWFISCFCLSWNFWINSGSAFELIPTRLTFLLLIKSCFSLLKKCNCSFWSKWSKLKYLEKISNILWTSKKLLTLRDRCLTDLFVRHLFLLYICNQRTHFEGLGVLKSLSVKESFPVLNDSRFSSKRFLMSLYGWNSFE